MVDPALSYKYDVNFYASFCPPMSETSESPYIPPFLLLTEDQRRDGIIPAAISDFPRGSPESDDVLPFEIMTAEERKAALEFHEMELDWFDWECLSQRRCLRTSRGVFIVQAIANRIVSQYFYVISS